MALKLTTTKQQRAPRVAQKLSKAKITIVRKTRT